MKRFYFTLFFALILCGFSNAQTFNAIESELQTILNQKGENLVDIHIYFKSNVDSKQLNQKTRKSFSKSERRNIVVSELKKHASADQADVLEMLKAEELNGNVSNINVLWISNSISCKASRDVIYKLSSHPDIKMIGSDKEIQMISPEQMKEIPATKANITRGPAHHLVTINADDVQNQGYTGKNIIVAVLDSGTNTEHVDLKDHLWKGEVDGEPVNGWNYIANNSNITDDYGHGTHCAGIVCGDGTSGTTAGVAPDASLMTLKVVGQAGGGTLTGTISAVQFAVENGADVMSMSLGWKHSQLTTEQKETIRETFDNVLTANVVVCAAVGNDGTSIGLPWNVDYPAACPAPWHNPDQTLEGGLSSVIAVGANDLIGQSSQGPSTWEDTKYNEYAYNDGASMGLIRPDISAPGNLITSSHYLVNDDQRLMSGTSQSTPCVAGVIALMLEKNGALTPADISRIIEETAADKPATKNNVVGAGRIDALAAVNAVTEGTGTPFIKLVSSTPETAVPGQVVELSLTFKNEGKGSSASATSTTISLDDQYITISNPTQTLGQISTGNSKTISFNITIDAQTPNGHIAVFNVETTSGTYTWESEFSVKVSATPNIVFHSATPISVNVDQDVDINVTMINNGTAAVDNPITLTLSTLDSDLKYVTIVDNETTINPLGVGATGTGTFTIRANNTVPHNYGFDFFLEIHSESNIETNYAYEFESDMDEWTALDAANNNISKPGTAIANPWWHSSEAAQHGKIQVPSHSGTGHLMSASTEAPYYYTKPLDNYLISPKKIKVSANSEFSFYARPTYNHPERFGVAISTSDNTAANFTTVNQWITEGTSWTKYTVDLSNYAGEEIYVAIRHFFTQDEWDNSLNGVDYDALCIDDIMLSNVAVNISHTPTYSYEDPNYFQIFASNMIELPKVEGLTATANSTSEIVLTWEAVDKAKGYNIYCNGNKIVSNTTETSYTHQNLEHNTQYCYEVAAVYSGEEFEHSNNVCATTQQKVTSVIVKEYSPETIYAGEDEEITFILKNDGSDDLPSRGSVEVSCDNQYVTLISGSANAPVIPSGVKPSAPTNVYANATGETTIELEWNATLGADNYNIYTGTSKIASTTSTNYTFTGLLASTEYCYYVTAVNEAGESDYSSSSCATTYSPAAVAPSTPTNLTADAITVGTGENAILLQWDAAQNATSYKILSGTSTIATGVTGTTYTVQSAGTNTLIEGEEYCYQVQAVNANGSSPVSDAACATVGKIEYYIQNSTGNCITIFDYDTHTGGTYGGVGVAGYTGKSTQKFTLEDAGNDQFYLLSKNGYYIYCQSWNVDAFTTGGTALVKEAIGTDDGFYIKRADNGNYFKTQFVDDGNNTYIFCDCAEATCKEIWELVPVISAAKSRSTSNRSPSISYSIQLLPSNAEMTNNIQFEVDPNIPNDTYVTFNIRVNNDTQHNSDPTNITHYNFSLPIEVLVKSDPGTPKNLIVKNFSDNSITLGWDAVANATSYNVYRGGEYIGNTSSTTYFDNGLNFSTEYCYTVTGINSNGESEHSKALCQTTKEENLGIVLKSYELETGIGKDINLTVTLVNKSGSATPAGTATLVCNDQYVNIVSGETTMEALAINGETTVTFVVNLSGTVPSNHVLDFDVTAEYDGGGTGGTVNIDYTFDEDLEGWTTMTSDDHSWYHSSIQGEHGYNKSLNTTPAGGGFIFSESYCNKVNKGFNPDHWIVSPEQIVPSGTTSIDFYACSMANQTTYADETFGVFVSTNSNTNPEDFTMIGSAVTLAKHSNSLEMAKKSFPLYNYEGQKIWVAIKHYGSGDNAALAIDDITILNTIESSIVSSTSKFSVTVNPTLNTFAGEGLWSDASKWSKGVVPTESDDIVINGNATIESGNVTVNSLMINDKSSATLTVNSGVILTVNSALVSATPDSFIINDGAQVLQSNEGVNATFSMLIDNPSSWGKDNKGGWQFISSPMEGVAISSFNPMTTDYDLFKYDGTQELQWINFKNHGTDFESNFRQGRGYIVSYEAQTKAEFKGTLNNEKSFTFSDISAYDSEDHYRNFYLLGNPFTFNMDWDGFSTVQDVYDGFATISYSDGSYTYHTSGTINVGDGFMVKSTGINPILSYGTAMRSKAKKEKESSINVIASSMYGIDNVVVTLAGQEDEGFTKLDNINKDIAEIYVENEGKRFGIFSFDKDVNEVKLSFDAKHTGNHIISVKPEGEYEYITLVDNLTGEETNMLNGRYEFTVFTSGKDKERFTLKFNEKTAPVSANFAYQSGNELIIEAEGTVQVIDVMGRIVLTEEVNDNGRINISGLDKAAYVIRCIGDSTIKTQKIVIL